MSIEKDLKKIYLKYYPMVLRRCNFLLRENEKVLDAVQETFIQLIERKKKIHNTYLSSYIYKTATNICLNQIKKNKTLEPLSDEITNEFYYQDNYDNLLETKRILNKIFANEKDSTRVIANLRYVDRLSLAQTAQLVGLSVSGVRKRIRNLKEKSQRIKMEL